MTRRQILDSSKLKEFADDSFKFDENERKLSKRVENTGGKKKLLVMSNFSFSHSVFKRLVSQGHQKMSLCGNPFSTSLLKTLSRVGKGEIARIEQFLVFPHCFLPFWRPLCHLHQI